MRQIGAYNSKYNAILPDVLVGIYALTQTLQSYCSCFYGSQLWDLSNNCIDKLCKSWRKSIRKALGIPLRTHCVYLQLLCNCLPSLVKFEK